MKTFEDKPLTPQEQTHLAQYKVIWLVGRFHKLLEYVADVETENETLRRQIIELKK